MRRLGYQFVASHWMNWLRTCLQNNLLSTCLYVSLYTFYWLLSELHWAWLAIKPVQNTLDRETIVFIITCRRERTPSRQRTDVFIHLHSFSSSAAACCVIHPQPPNWIEIKLVWLLCQRRQIPQWSHCSPLEDTHNNNGRRELSVLMSEVIKFFLESSMFCNLLHIFKRFSFNHRFTVPTL